MAHRLPAGRCPTAAENAAVIVIGHAPTMSIDQLSLPTTFVLDKNGVIRIAFVEEDWSKRLDPDILS